MVNLRDISLGTQKKMKKKNTAYILTKVSAASGVK